MNVRGGRGDVKQTTARFWDPLIMQSLSSHLQSPLAVSIVWESNGDWGLQC